MTNASTRKSAAAAKRSPLTLAGVGHGLQGWLIRNKFYIIAFFIPVALTYLAWFLELSFSLCLPAFFVLQP